MKDLVMLDAASKDELEVGGVCVNVCIVMREQMGLRARRTFQKGAVGC